MNSVNPERSDSGEFVAFGSVQLMKYFFTLFCFMITGALIIRVADIISKNQCNKPEVTDFQIPPINSRTMKYNRYVDIGERDFVMG